MINSSSSEHSCSVSPPGDTDPPSAPETAPNLDSSGSFSVPSADLSSPSLWPQHWGARDSRPKLVPAASLAFTISPTSLPHCPTPLTPLLTLQLQACFCLGSSCPLHAVSLTSFWILTTPWTTAGPVTLSGLTWLSFSPSTYPSWYVI